MRVLDYDYNGGRGDLVDITGGSTVKLIKAFIANAEPIAGEVDSWHVDLTFEDALPDETVEIAIADLPMTGIRVLSAIATTREAALTISGEEY